MVYREGMRERLERMTRLEKEYWGKGVFPGGIDEAGRGPLAGPVVAACVVMPADDLIEGVNDSKKIAEKRREVYSAIIQDKAVSIGIGIVDNKIIDKINILQATRLACAQAYEQMPVKPDTLLIDALKELDINAEQIPIIHGDAKSYLIACASIIAKVTRDRIMIEYDKQYPQYGFAQHKGYGTKQHIQNILKYGECELHRKTFIKKIYERQ